MSQELSPQQREALNINHARIYEVESLVSRLVKEGLGTAEEKEAEKLFCNFVQEAEAEDARIVPLTAEADRLCCEAIIQFSRRNVSIDALKNLMLKVSLMPKDKVPVILTDKKYKKNVSDIVKNTVEPRLAHINAAEEGNRRGIQDVLNLLQGEKELMIYRRDLIELVAVPDYVEDGTVFELPTRIEGINVNYFYADTDPAPRISLVIEPAMALME
ncbi:MAG: hypothetical protein Q7T54_00365 [Candidatus Levybacteria bacterium]|nr:hypothetical protein [Candidatus Levybacteria bacterium]